MNKVLLIGRLTKDPDVVLTNSGIKYARFNIAIDRIFGENQVDFVPIITWRNQAEFVERYLKKGMLISIEGRFSSSTFQNSEGQNITRYEVSADRVEALETKNQVQNRSNNNNDFNKKLEENVLKTNDDEDEIKISKNATGNPLKDIEDDIPWDLDL